MSGTAQAVQVATVVVRLKDLTNDDLPAAISQFVLNVTRAGAYLPHELPPKATQVHHLGYYVGQVSNGGHAQFLHNSNSLGAFQTVAAGALAALKAMGAEKQHQVLAAMVAWAAANSEASREVHVNAMKGFDKRFWAAENERPIFETWAEDERPTLAGRWISNWPELQIVKDDRYDLAIEEIAALNPFRVPRLAWRNVQSIRYQITDPVQIAIAVACGAVGPEPETKTRVAGHVPFLEIEGKQCVGHIVQTDKGKRLCVCDDEGARLYAYHEDDQRAKRAPGEDTMKYLSRRAVSSVGSRLSAVDAATIQRFVKVANETQAPEAIELLLRRAGLSPAATVTAWGALENEALWIAFTDGRLVVARTFSHGATLVGFDGPQLVAITKSDIECHAAEMEMVAAAMQAAT